MNQKTKIITFATVGVLAVSGIAFGAKGSREHNDMKRIFSPQLLLQQADTNNDNAVELAELEALVTARFGMADVDQNGEVNKGDVIAALEENIDSKRIKRRSGRIADRLFASADINEDGALTKNELMNRVSKFYALVDWNDDSNVNLEEVKRMRAMMPLQNRRHKDVRSAPTE